MASDSQQVISRLVLKNISRLFRCAELLAAKRQYGPAVHIMMAAREECAKWIVLHCWNHLDRDIRRKLYNHMFKHELGYIFHFLSGRMQMGEMASAGLEALMGRDPEWDKSASVVAAYIQDKSNNYDQKRLAEQITIFLNDADRTQASKDLQKNDILSLERDRTGSVYVDVNERLIITADPFAFKFKAYKRYRDHVLLARYYIDRLRGRRRNKRVLHHLFPRWKSETRNFVKGLLRKAAKERAKMKPGSKH